MKKAKTAFAMTDHTIHCMIPVKHLDIEIEMVIRPAAKRTSKPKKKGKPFQLREK